MALLGEGALVIWNDVAPSSECEFDHWQIKEHMPERLSVPGFLRGRRYTAASGQPRYFTFYETASVETLGSRPYLTRLDAPTPWSRQIFQLWRNTIRSACHVTASHGQGMGGYIATIELAPDPGQEAVLRDWLNQSALPQLLEHPCVVGAHLLEADRTVIQIATVEKRERGGADAVIHWVVLVEAVDPEPLKIICRESLETGGLRQHRGALGWQGVYRLVYALATADEMP